VGLPTANRCSSHIKSKSKNPQQSILRDLLKDLRSQLLVMKHGTDDATENFDLWCNQTMSKISPQHVPSFGTPELMNPEEHVSAHLLHALCLPPREAAMLDHPKLLSPRKTDINSIGYLPWTGGMQAHLSSYQMAGQSAERSQGKFAAPKELPSD